MAYDIYVDKHKKKFLIPVLKEMNLYQMQPRSLMTETLKKYNNQYKLSMKKSNFFFYEIKAQT